MQMQTLFMCSVVFFVVVVAVLAIAGGIFLSEVIWGDF